MSEISEHTEQGQQHTNRRVYYRLQMRSVCYIDMGDGNGGVMLNLSEGGFTVQAAEILANNRFPRMRFRLPKSERWVEACGKMIWHGKSGKEAGVEFVDLSDEGRQLIRDWMFAQTFAQDHSSQNEGARPAWEVEKALADTASIAKPRSVSVGAEREWSSFFPNESELSGNNQPRPRAKGGSISKIERRADNFFPEESKLPLLQAVRKEEAELREEREKQQGSPVPASLNTSISAVEIAGQPAADQPLKLPEQIKISATVLPPRQLDDDTNRQNAPSAPLPVSRAPQKSPFSEVLAATLISKPDYNYISAYQSEATSSSRTPWFLTAIVAFAAGLGFAFLIAFGPLDFIRADIHQRLNPSAAAQPESGQKSVLDETAPKPPDIFSESAAPAKRDTGGPQNQRSPGTAAEPDIKPAAQSRASAPPLAENSDQTESFPVSPNVQQSPGAPTGYVASNSRFLSISRDADSRESNVDADGSVRIGQLIYSPQAVYPEEALRMHVEGIVKLHAIVAEDGTVRTLSSASGPPVLVAAATETVRDWRYEPTLVGKTPVESEREIVFVFSL